MAPRCKVAIITGGTDGSGFSTACHLLKNCARHVIITGLDKESGESAVEQIEEQYGDNKVTFVQGDVNCPEHLEEVFELACDTFGGVDILFNNAAILEDKKWSKEVDTNFKSVVRGTLLAFKYMGIHRGGHGGLVVNNSSIAGLRPNPAAPIYTITKYAVVGATLNFGHKFHNEKTGIRVCALCPSAVDTAMLSEVCNNQLKPEWGKATLEKILENPLQSEGSSCNKEFMTPKCKVAIVTGGATGIGFSAACHLLKEGAKHVIINGPDKNEGESAVSQLEERYSDQRVTFLCGDVNDEDHFESLFELANNAFGGVDILFNNAGMLNDKQWENEIDTNIKGVIRGTLLAFKYMGKDCGGNGGIVINNASIVGLQTLAGSPVYSSTKWGIIGSALSFGDSFHYKCTGVRVCAVCPGVTETELISGASEKQLTPEWSCETARELGELPAQSPDMLGQGIIHIIRYGPTSSVWVVEDSKILRVNFLDLKCISKVVCKLEC